MNHCHLPVIHLRLDDNMQALWHELEHDIVGNGDSTLSFVSTAPHSLRPSDVQYVQFDTEAFVGKYQRFDIIF